MAKSAAARSAAKRTGHHPRAAPPADLKEWQQVVAAKGSPDLTVSIGMVGKFFAEAIEHVDPKPIEAARAAGATPVQVILHAILPQVLPQMADTVIYRWEYHFRASVVLGAVGAGGIGTELLSSLRIMDYQQVSAILICILACVTVVDAIGMALRRRLK